MNRIFDVRTLRISHFSDIVVSYVEFVASVSRRLKSPGPLRSLDDSSTASTTSKAPGPLRSRASLRSSSLASLARAVLASSWLEAGRPLSFPPCRLGRRRSPSGRASDSWRPAGPAIPGGRPGQRPRTRPRPPHASPADSLARAFGAHSVIPRTIWLATADGPSLRSGRVGGTRASARQEVSRDQRARWC